MKKGIITIVFTCLTCTLFAQASKEKITELFKLMKTDSLMLSTLDNTSKMFMRSSPKGSSATKDSLFRAYAKTETILFSKRMLENEMVDIYAKYFSDQDINKYIDFYKSPEGQKMTTMLPLIQNDIMTSMMKTELPRLQEKFAKKLEELDNQ